MTDYDEYNLYRMDVKYDYDLDRLIEYGITDNQSFVDAIVKEALPILPVHIKAPDFGCSAFTLQEADGNVLMGRNYDFKRDTSAMLVYVSFSYFKTTGSCLKTALCYYFNVIVLSFRLYPITSSQFLRRAISAVRLVSS